MLEAAGMNPIVAGNIGTPLCEAAQEATEDNWMVVELSSFQLKGTETFRPKIGCLLNIAETHLDYHGSMKDYVDSKSKLFANQVATDTAVLNWDDPFCRELVPYVKASILPFSRSEELTYGVFVSPSYITGQDDDLMRRIIYRNSAGQETIIADVDSISLPGRFNVENALAACGIAIAAGADPSLLGDVLASFRGVEHRLEYVADKAGVTYYNNSKATNSKATIMALTSFQRPVVLIAGGLDRGSDYMELLPVLSGRVKAIVALGETRDKLTNVAQLAGLKQIISVDNGESAAAVLEQAVQEASALAEEGDVVLLSPACASWDMFTSYEERGCIFKEAVHNL
jgi:UDP-N-acetylmuramoylalanine--D-glutamate ligase